MWGRDKMGFKSTVFMPQRLSSESQIILSISHHSAHIRSQSITPEVDGVRSDIVQTAETPLGTSRIGDGPKVLRS